MKRIDTAYVEIDKFGSGKDGFTNGDPGVTPRTVVDADWFDGVQEAICRAEEEAGFTLTGADSQFEQAVLNKVAIYDVTGSGVASGTKLTLAANSGDTSDFTLASNAVLPPSKGLYLVSITLFCLASPTANPQVMTVDIHFGGVLVSIKGTRFSATNTDGILLSASIAQVIDPSLGSPNGEIWLSSGTSNLTISGASNNFLTIARLHGTP